MLISVTAAAALTGGLAVQMASGHDPALGSGHKAVATGGASGGSASASQSGDDLFGAAPPASSVTTRAS